MLAFVELRVVGGWSGRSVGGRCVVPRTAPPTPHTINRSGLCAVFGIRWTFLGCSGCASFVRCKAWPLPNTAGCSVTLLRNPTPHVTAFRFGWTLALTSSHSRSLFAVIGRGCRCAAAITFGRRGVSQRWRSGAWVSGSFRCSVRAHGWLCYAWDARCRRWLRFGGLDWVGCLRGFCGGRRCARVYRSHHPGYWTITTRDGRHGPHFVPTLHAVPPC
jgi:hypothetical protein